MTQTFYQALSDQSRSLWQIILGYDPYVPRRPVQLEAKFEDLDEIAKIMTQKPLSHNELKNEQYTPL